MMEQERNQSGKAGRIIWMILLACLLHFPGQTQSLTIPSSEVCEGDQALLSILATDLTNVGAVTLYIDFKADKLLFDSLLAIHPALQLSSFNYFVDTIAGEAIAHLALSWSSLTSVNFYNDTILTAVVHPLADSAEVLINSASEFADQTGSVLPSSFTSGFLTLRANPEILESPFSAYLFFGYLELGVVASQADRYQWQYLVDSVWTDIVDLQGFSGEQTSNLVINSFPDGVFEMTFRCAIIGCDSLFTDPAGVYIDIGIVDESPEVPVNIEFDKKNNELSIIPFGRYESINYNYRVLSVYGSDLITGNAMGRHQLRTEHFAAGNYLVLLLFGDDSSSIITKKITILH